MITTLHLGPRFSRKFQPKTVTIIFILINATIMGNALLIRMVAIFISLLSVLLKLTKLLTNLPNE